MKKLNMLLILSILCLAEMPSMAQRQTFIDEKDENIESGGYLGVVLKVTELDGESEVITGIQGAWVINHTFVLGGAGYNVATDINGAVPDRFQYSGPFVEYIVLPHKVIHFSANTLIGLGS